MSIIGSTFEELKNNNSRALVTYTVAGDPDLKDSEKIIENLRTVTLLLRLIS